MRLAGTKSRCAISTLAASLLLMAGASCGGGDEGVTAEAEPSSGPPGTEFVWTASGCPETHEKQAMLLREEGVFENVIVESTPGQASSGTLTVPAATPPGTYPLYVHCRLETELQGGNTSVSIVPMSDTSFFEVTA